MRLFLQAVLAATVSILSANIALAAPAKPLFASDDMLHLTLRGPIDHISRDRADKPVPGVLTVEGGAPESLPVALSVRGTTRRMKAVCAFPPLRVAFTQKPSSTSLFKGQKQLKLVTHCQSAKSSQQYVLLEYAAYLLYRALTPESFDVRLAQVDYVDEGGQPITSRLGFFIEDVGDVVRRNGQIRLRGAKTIAVSQLDPAAAARFAVFQFMISNLDWSMTNGQPGEDCCHNSRIAGTDGATTGLIPLPYDFDYAGLVNAPYAVPPAGISVSNVRVRRYRGFCQHNDQVQALSADLTARRASLLAVLDQIPQLDQETHQRAVSYLGDFFDQIGSPQKVTELLETCLR